VSDERIDKIKEAIESIYKDKEETADNTLNSKYSDLELHVMILDLLYDNIRIKLVTQRDSLEIMQKTDKITKRAYIIAWMSLVASSAAIGVSVFQWLNI